MIVSTANEGARAERRVRLVNLDGQRVFGSHRGLLGRRRICASARMLRWLKDPEAEVFGGLGGGGERGVLGNPSAIIEAFAQQHVSGCLAARLNSSG